MFQKATRQQARLRLGITGPSGSGKTYSALLLARGIGGKSACIDTEQGSASLYAHLCDFDTLNLEPPYRPERFVEAVRSAEAAGYNVLVIDSITHEWNGSGGCLELVDEAVDDVALRFFDSGCPSAPFALSSSLGPVFIDGSAFDTGMSFPTAAFAIVQLLEHRVGACCRSVTGLAPSSMQSSVAAAERLAIAIATTLVCQGDASKTMKTMNS
jgi:hypothetical protein